MTEQPMNVPGWNGIDYTTDPFLLGMVDHHMYRVEVIDDETTRFRQTDQVRGGAAGIVGGLMARTMKNMYVGFNRELKAEAEGRRSVRV